MNRLLVFMGYIATIPFEEVASIMGEVNLGWLVRLLHFNIVSLLFVFLYYHIFKGLYVGGYRLTLVSFYGLCFKLVSNELLSGDCNH
ncbi:cytochrome b [Blattella germanica]|nr:cytochrome b [Blattella germanica]